MGELFRRNRPSSSLAWTGERLVSSIGGFIENEHLHRYLLARDLCRHKRVVDVASGEGYGTALIAQTAEDASGVEIDPASVEHSSRSYSSPNLRYLVGSATKLPLESNSVDVVVSFETLEHFFEHELFLSEVKRVLRHDGFLLISTPDADVYSSPGSEANPFHVRELTKSAFLQFLEGSFSNVRLLRQRALAGSVIVPEHPDCRPGATRMFEQRDLCTFESHQVLPRAPYLLAVASEAALPQAGLSVYLQADDPSGEVAVAKKELQRLQEMEARTLEEAPVIAKQLADAEAAHADAQRLSSLLSKLEQDSTQLSAAQARAAASQAEAARLGAVLLETQANEAKLRDAAKKLQDQIVNIKQGERERTQQVSALQTSVAQTIGERDQARQQLESVNLLLRQQTLIVLRTEKELVAQTRRAQAISAEMEQGRASKERCLSELEAVRHSLSAELAAVKAILAASEAARNNTAAQIGDAIHSREHIRQTLSRELEMSRETAARYELLSKDLASLVIPVWMRKLIPTPFRPIARAMKRSKGPQPPDA